MTFATGVSQTCLPHHGFRRFVLLTGVEAVDNPVMLDTPVYFAFPGDLDTPSGGYHYDRRLIAGLGSLGAKVVPVALPQCSLPLANETRTEVAKILAQIPDQSIVIIDGLAFGVLDEVAAAEAERLCLVALCHHPLALETGHSERDAQLLLESERRALSFTRATLVTSEHTRQILIQQFAQSAEKVVVARPGTERVKFAECTGEPPLLLTLASLTRRKAHDLLIDALANLKDYAWRARFVGSPDFDPAWSIELRDQVRRLDLSERIEFAGPVADAQVEYQNADAFVLPSRYEGYGMVFAEALAAGLPVIGARAGAVPEVVPEGAGLLVPPDDSDALTAALRKLLTSASEREKMQSGARRAAESLPTWADTAAIVLKTLQGIGKESGQGLRMETGQR